MNPKRSNLTSVRAQSVQTRRVERILLVQVWETRIAPFLSLPFFSFAVYDRLPFTVHRPFWTNDGRKSPVFTVFGNPVMRSQADIYLTEQDLLLMCDPIAGTSPTASSPQCIPVRKEKGA